eukprot:s870_g17.t1
MFAESKDLIVENEDLEDPFNQETEIMETLLSELKEGDDDGELPEELSEGEAAEILSTMITQRRTYAQSMKQKKQAELSRGYGKPWENRNKGSNGPFKPGRYQVTIEELKKRTRCNLCQEKGHWKRECPKRKDKSSTSAEAHYLENDMFGSNEEAFFCGLLELTGSISERGSMCTDSEVGCPEPSLDRDSIAPEQYMLSKTDLFMFENYFCDVVSKSPCIPDESCATLDTGCQRLAIGKNTLESLMKYLPKGLHVHLVPASNTFRSVHGVSSTTNLAAIPCAIGPKGCYLRPALFENGFGVDAPFLISLPFLLKTRGQLVLDQKQGLQLRMAEPRCEINIHLGPSGALRIPLMQFDEEVLRLKVVVNLFLAAQFLSWIVTMEGPANKRARDGRTFSAQHAWAQLLKKFLYLIYQLTPLLELLIRRADHRAEEELEDMSVMSDSSWSRIRGGLSSVGSPLHRASSPTSRASTSGTRPSNHWVSQTEANPDKIFARCPKPRGQQCRFFQWYQIQPLDDVTAWRYKEDAEGNPRTHEEMLTAMIQDKCEHKNLMKVGSNGVQDKKTCKTCKKVWITKKEKPVSTSASTQDQAFKEFQEFQEWKRSKGKK